MFFDEIWAFIIKFLQANFNGLFKTWGQDVPKELQSLDWNQIECWIMFFPIFVAILVVLLCKTNIVEKLSKYIFPLSIIIWFLGVIVYIVGFYNTGVNGFSVVLRAIVSSFKMFVVSNDLARVNNILRNDTSYMAMFSILHFVAAFIAFLFIFKMLGYKIKSMWKIFKYKHSYDSKGCIVHLFWGVNEASCLLAESINKEYPKETIIFIDIDKECEDEIQKKTTLSYITNIITIKSSDIKRFEKKNIYVDHCYNGPAAFSDEAEIDVFAELNLKNIAALIKKSNCACFYFLSNNESQNLAGALNLQRDKTLRSMVNNRPVIYVHARRDANNEIFDHYSQYDESQRLKIKIVDSAYLSIEPLKSDDGAMPVNCVDVDEDTGLVKHPFTSLIVGFGATGQEAFKFLYEYAAFIGTDMKKNPFKCYAIDENMERIAGLLREKMPAIGDDELSLIQTVVNSDKFWKKIKSIIGELNYVVIALNDDNIGLSLAVNLFKYALRYRSANLPMLKIMLRCYEKVNEKRMSEVVNNLNKSIEGENVEIRLFGREKELYSYDTILSNTTMEEAKMFNKVYEKSDLAADKQWDMNFGNINIKQIMIDKKISRYHAIHDMNRRIAQNISNSLHGSHIIKLMGADKNKERLICYYKYVNSRKDGTTTYICDERDAQLLKNMAMVEHERWIASHKLMGYVYNPKNDCVKKYHKCMCPWENLDERTRSYDCKVVDTTIKIAYEKLKKSHSLN